MKNNDVETELRARIAQLEADVIYIRGIAERANEDADKADEQNKRLRAQRDELVQAAADFLGIEFLHEVERAKNVFCELLKKYEQ